MQRIIHKIGYCGRFQHILTVIVFIGFVLISVNMFIVVIMGMQPVNLYCPVNDKLGVTRKTMKMGCVTHCNQPYLNLDDSFSFSLEWQLVCAKSDAAKLAQSVQMVGVACGSVSFGVWADKSGRLRPVLLSIFGSAASNLLTFASHSFETFLVTRFINGLFTQGFIMVCFTYLMEFMHPDWRGKLNSIIQLSSPASIALLAALGFGLRHNWRLIAATFAVLQFFCFLLALWFFVESPLWLYNKTIAASSASFASTLSREGSPIRIVLDRIASWNGTRLAQVGEHDLLENSSNSRSSSTSLTSTTSSFSPSSPTSSSSDAAATAIKMIEAQNENKRESGTSVTALHSNSDSIREVFRNRRLRVWTIVNMLCWCVNSLVYYCLTIAATEFNSSTRTSPSSASPSSSSTTAANLFTSSSSRLHHPTQSLHSHVALNSVRANYATFASSGLIELPAGLLVLLTIDRFGRRPTLIAAMLLCSVCCLCCASPLFSTSSSASNSFIYFFFTAGKLLISITFTVIYVHTNEIYPTSVRISCFSLCSLAARFGGIIAPFLLTMNQSVTMLNLAVVTLISALSCILLPETTNKRLSNTISETITQLATS